MKKKLFVFLCIMSALLIPVSLFAQNRIIDNAGLMNAGEKAVFETRMAELASGYNFDLRILVEKSIGASSPINYSWNYLDGRGLGGKDWDGCLLLLVTGKGAGDRDYMITASGRGSEILNNTAYERLDSKVQYCLLNSDFTGAYDKYISIWEEYLELEAKGRSYNFITENNSIIVIVVWIISLLIGLLTVRKWKNDMNTAIAKTEAGAYVVPGSLAFTQSSDRFLYSTVTKTRKQKQASSGGSSMRGGGRSSRGGKF